MSRVIPKESLTAYQRWELGAVDIARDAPVNTTSTPASQEVEAGEVTLPTAEEIERIHQTAWQEGHDLGYEQGRGEGLANAAQEIERLRDQMARMAEALNAERLRQDEQISREVLDLALVVARQMIRAAILVKEDLVLEVVREALANLPTISGHMILAVHPDEVARLREWLNAEPPQAGVRVVADHSLELGGFRIESSNSEMNGSMPSRWREIVACLGTDVRWLD